MVEIEKYRARNLSELIISQKILQDISNWLKSWESGIPKKRSIILHGPPGTGKTTTAFAIAGEMGLPLIEMNASSDRSSDSMKRIAKMASAYMDLSSFIDGGKRDFEHIILIDEADNIFESRNPRTGGDTGGLSELARIVKSSHCPIIITMNDFYEFRRKSAGNDIVENSVVLDFRQFQRVRDNDYKTFKLSLLQRIRQIATEEGLVFDVAPVETAIERSRDDIRSILNDSLSSFSFRDEERRPFESSERDSRTSIFDCMRDTFKSGNYEKILSDLMDRDFETEDYIMWIDQNIPREIHEPEDLASAYDLVSRADLFLGRVLHKQHYAFKGYAEEIAAGVSFSIENRNSHFVKYDFPSTILKMSRLRDARESRKLLLTKLSRTCHTDIAKISEDMWFFSRLARNKKILSSMESRLSLSEKELAILRKG